jgi:hypothetical protein
VRRGTNALLALVLAAVVSVATTSAALADVVGVVRGTLTGARQQPVAHAGVTLSSVDLVLTATTDAAGRFAFPRVPFGRYTIDATTPDGQAETTVNVVTGSVAEVALHPATAIGRSKATTASVHGSPVSVNTLAAGTIATLPANTNIDRVIETLPGVVRFSFDEPVVDGFHGVT